MQSMPQVRVGFPNDFRPQPVRLPDAVTLAIRSSREIVAFFRDHPDVANDFVTESLDKRWMPSTFIEHLGKTYRVGWFTAECKVECEAIFDNLADAATDYLLFSLGKARCTPKIA